MTDELEAAIRTLPLHVIEQLARLRELTAADILRCA